MVAWLLTQHIVVLFLIIACGFLLVKLGILKSSEGKTISAVVIYLIMPCSRFSAFQIDYTPEIKDGFLLALLAAIALYLLVFLMCWLFNKAFKLTPVEKVSLIYSNSGNLVIPLVMAVLGPKWVIYTTAFSCVENMLLWSHGQAILQGELKFNFKKIFGNVNIIACALGIVFFFTGLKLPRVCVSALNSIALCIGPMSMLTIGMLLADVDLKNVLSGKRLYLITLLKMLVLPGVLLLFLKYSGISALNANGHLILLVSLLAIITPSATTLVQMAQVYGCDAKYAGAINVLTTIVSIITMPLMIFLYML